MRDRGGFLGDELKKILQKATKKKIRKWLKLTWEEYG